MKCTLLFRLFQSKKKLKVYCYRGANIYCLVRELTVAMAIPQTPENCPCFFRWNGNKIYMVKES